MPKPNPNTLPSASPMTGLSAPNRRSQRTVVLCIAIGPNVASSGEVLIVIEALHRAEEEPEHLEKARKLDQRVGDEVE